MADPVLASRRMTGAAPSAAWPNKIHLVVQFRLPQNDAEQAHRVRQRWWVLGRCCHWASNNSFITVLKVPTRKKIFIYLLHEWLPSAAQKSLKWNCVAFFNATVMNCPDAGAGNSGSTDPVVIEVSTPALLTLDVASEIGIIYCKCISPRPVPHHPTLPVRTSPPPKAPFLLSFIFSPLSFKVFCNMSKWKIQLQSNSAASVVHLWTLKYSSAHPLLNTWMLNYIKRVMRMLLFKHWIVKGTLIDWLKNHTINCGLIGGGKTVMWWNKLQSEKERVNWDFTVSLSAAIQLVLDYKCRKIFTSWSVCWFSAVAWLRLHFNPSVWLQQILDPAQKGARLKTQQSLTNANAEALLTSRWSPLWSHLCPWWDTLSPGLSWLCTDPSSETPGQNPLSPRRLHLTTIFSFCSTNLRQH